MACFSPLNGYQDNDGTVRFHATGAVLRELRIPCGQCIGCRIDRSRSWAVRCMFEAQMHQANSFVTLTYSDQAIPKNGSLHYPDFQLFMRKLRDSGRKARFFMVGEYGGQTFRPHYHALLFGQDFFDDRKIWRFTPQGHQVYVSPALAKLWPHGNHEIGDITFESAAYCARYCIKKVTGEPADLYYRRPDPVSGELVSVQPEFARMSLKPGIGRPWFDQYADDLEGWDAAIVNGRKYKVPRYLDNLRKLKDGERFEETEFTRFLKSRRYLDDNTPERLAVRASVALAKNQLNQRKLHNDLPNSGHP